MPTIFDSLKTAVVELLRPGTSQESGELSALRQLYDPANSGNPQPNRWCRIHNEGGLCVGFSYTCLCMREFQMLNHMEYGRDYECMHCRAKINLFKSVGITDAEGNFKVKLAEIERVLAKLPVRPRLAGRREHRFVDTWSSTGEAVSWESDIPRFV